MKDTVRWLRTVEEFASELYFKSSVFLDEDAGLARFLHGLAIDESWHFHLMGRALQYLESNEVAVAEISLDEVTVRRVEGPLRNVYDALRKGTLSAEEMLAGLVQAETSEWNAFFLYVINTLSTRSKPFQYGASIIQGHMQRIERFLDTREDGSRYLDSIRKLPSVWRPRFLVVDDEEPLRDLLADLLRSRGFVDTAKDGKEGLQKARQSYFDVIVSDIGMPNMTGLEFHRRMTKDEPRMVRNLVFLSGEITPEMERYCFEHALSYLRKPCTVQSLMETVDQILMRFVDESHQTAQLFTNSAREDPRLR